MQLFGVNLALRLDCKVPCAAAEVHNATFRRQPCVALEVTPPLPRTARATPWDILGPIHSLPGVHRANPEVCLISPIIHRLQPELDDQQRAVVGHLEGPLLVIAGPGAGKTRAVVWRAVNLLLQGACSLPPSWRSAPSPSAPPGNCASGLTPPPTRPAAPDDLSAVRVSTVHSLCRRIVSQHGKARRLQIRFCDLLDEWGPTGPDERSLPSHLRPRPGRVAPSRLAHPRLHSAPGPPVHRTHRGGGHRPGATG